MCGIGWDSVKTAYHLEAFRYPADFGESYAMELKQLLFHFFIAISGLGTLGLSFTEGGAL